jgi:hypothetical protein
MKYSFKNHIQNEYYLFLLYMMSIILLALYVCIIVFTVLNNFITSKAFNLDLLLGLLNYLIFLPILSLILFAVLLLRIYNVNDFLKNCSEIDGKIEKCLAFYGSRNYTQKEGTETAIRVTFSYTINNNKYTGNIQLPKNKHTVKYIDIYKRQGETVRILVGNKNPKKIMIKEIFVK